MRIGLCGAHRTGKTTLANALAAETGCRFIPGDLSRIFFELGLCPSDTLSPEQRMTVQELMLEHLERRLDGRQNFITDRTPIDMIGYLFADLQQSDFQGDIAKRAHAYVKRCYELANKHFDLIVRVAPGIQVVPGALKGSLNETYIMGLHHGITGALFDSGCNFYMLPAHVTKLDERVRVLKSYQALFR